MKRIILQYLSGTQEVDISQLLTIDFVFDNYEISVDFDSQEDMLNVHIPSVGRICVVPQAANYVKIRKL